MSKEQLIVIIAEAYNQGAEIYLTKEGLEFLNHDRSEHTEGI